jgi:chromosomal replication initiator protein
MPTERRDMPEALGEVVPTLDEIVAAVARGAKVEVADIKGRRRTGNLVEARHTAMFLAATMTRLSYADIGRGFGDRDHGTVNRGVDRIRALRSREPSVCDRLAWYAHALRKGAAERFAKGDAPVAPVGNRRRHGVSIP